MRKRIAIAMLAMLTIGSFSFVANLAIADTQFEGTWVRMQGIITKWGSDDVFGWVGAHAGMVKKNGTYHEWARAHAIWSYERPRLNCTRPPTENFTIICYVAKLVNTSDVALNSTDFYITGLWDVVKITTNITVILNELGQVISITFTRQFESVATKEQGELHVFLATPYGFELSIAGIDLLKGLVRRIDIRNVEIKICDIDGDGKVDIIDLVKVAKRYRAVPGLWTYDEVCHHMDFNFNAEIDIGDLTTVAANIEG